MDHLTYPVVFGRDSLMHYESVINMQAHTLTLAGNSPIPLQHLLDKGYSFHVVHLRFEMHYHQFFSNCNCNPTFLQFITPKTFT